MQFQRHVDKWWFEPKLRKPRVRIPKHLHTLDPATNDLAFAHTSRIGGFMHSRHWLRYNRLQSIDVGYLTPLYDLNAIAGRYGLSDAGKRYFRKHILPEPYDIVRRRSVQAHHWSRFTLMVLDVVLGDLEGRGYLQFLKSFEDHVTLLHNGVNYLHDHYRQVAEHRKVDFSDRHGVQWVE